MERFFAALVAAARRSSDDVLNALDEAARALDPAIDAFLFFSVSASGLSCRHASGARSEHFAAASIAIASAALPARALREASALCCADANSCVMPGDRSAVAIPMISERSIHGVWYAASATSSRLRPSVPLLTLAACAGEAYLLALERERDRNDATFDALTGVLAPRAFRSRLHELLANARDTVLSLWFVDTDRFKKINDGCGHEAGDAVLQRMAALLVAHAVPEIDVVGRKGGDEFCMLVCSARKMRAIERARAFCDAVRAHDFELPVRLTASVGVASFPFDAADAAALLEAADAAMYHAKRSGRDRVAYSLEGAGFALYE